MHPPASLAPLATDSTVVYYPLPEDMKEEVTAAVEFFLKMVETPHLTPSIPRLGRNLTKALSNKYKDHWFLDSPQRGQAYRCIEVCDNQSADRVLAEAVAESGLQYSELRLPAELCVWVDPKEVACRFGDELGSFLPIYINENGKKRKFVDKFNFSRLCERSVIGPVHMGRSSNSAVERSTMRRVSESRLTTWPLEPGVASAGAVMEWPAEVGRGRWWAEDPGSRPVPGRLSDGRNAYTNGASAGLASGSRGTASEAYTYTQPPGIRGRKNRGR